MLTVEQLHKEIEWTEGHPCAKCEHLQHCMSILHTLEPLPCFDGGLAAVEERTCLNCGAVFVARDRRMKYCCQKCQQRHYRKTKRHRKYLEVERVTCNT